MGYLHHVTPKEGECAGDFAQRLIINLIEKCPDVCTQLHIIADRYDGMHGTSQISLKNASGCHARRKSSLVVYKIEMNKSIDY